MFKMSKIITNKWFIFFIVLLIFGSGIFYLSKRGEKVIEIKGGNNLNGGQENFSITVSPGAEEKKSPISGLECDNYKRRPIAVMIADDPVARPASGIYFADLVVEMPVITGDITRMMAVFQCENPEKIGSIRSTRHDYIPLARGLDAILVHWGGSHYALNILKNKIMDNIDVLSSDSFFWREPGFSSPNNGYSSMANILKAMSYFTYRQETNFSGYPHFIPDNMEKKSGGILEIGYTNPYNVRYEYDPKTNSYFRWRGGIAEKDRLNGKQIEAKNIIVMRAFSRQLEKDYNDVDVEGEGRAVIYRNGDEIKGSWQKAKDNQTSKLYFFDEKGKEIEFVPGQIWIEIVEPYQRVVWSTEQ